MNCLRVTNCSFLDLTLFFEDDHTCYMYAPRSEKPLLNFRSSHPKLVKNSIAFSCCKSALSKTCHHLMRQSLEGQVARLKQAGFPSSSLLATCEKAVKYFKSPNESKKACEPEKMKMAVIPYVHTFSHRLKKIGRKYNVKVICSAKSKLSRVCPAVERMYNKGRADLAGKCDMRHTMKFVECNKKGVVYQLPMSCGRTYVGQSGRCVNVRLREHHSSLKCRPSSHLSLHCAECKCTPCFDDTTILFQNGDQTAREVAEAFFIARFKDKCISHPSLSLSDKEIDLLVSGL